MTEHYAVVADLPLGAYRGRQADGATDPVPAPARLHGALLQAAAQGTRAVLVDGALAPAEADLAALAWLEEHPPDGVRIPATRTTPGALRVYRDEGTLKKEGGAPTPQKKKAAKTFAGVVAVSGPFAWTWSSAPPQPVQASLAALVTDVSHLGTSESPARLRVGTATPTHRLREDASLFDAVVGAQDLDVAVSGRTTALVARYAVEQRRPSLAQDRYATSEDPRPRGGWPEARAVARYVVDRPPAPTALWEVVHHAPLTGPPIMDDERVAVAVATHRALIRIIGEGAPPLLTGAYPAEAHRPANRVAIQVLPADLAALAGLDGATDHLLLMVPHSADPQDAMLVSQAFERLTRIGRRGGATRELGSAATRGSVPGGAFWHEPPAGVTRLWRTDPVAVPETRAPRTGEWRLDDVVRLACALVARDHRLAHDGAALLPTVAGSGHARYRALADHMTALRVHVLDAAFVRTTDAGVYVHKAPERGVVRPYRATLSLGGWAGPRWLVALGQSRHLGGGLLVPVDVPADVTTGRLR